MTAGALSNRTAIVTGASRGIGAAIAVNFAGEGARLALAARTAFELERVADACRAAGAECSIHIVDVANRNQVHRFVKAVESPDILVNCAGVLGPVGPLVENNLDDWEDCLRVNLMGTLHACREVIPGMVARGRGSIINLSGGGSVTPRPNFSAYAVSKAAVLRLTETLAAEVKGTGVRVNALAPGVVDTRIQDGVLAAGDRAGDDYRKVMEMLETGKGAVPPSLPAGLALFLASDASARLSGKLISAVHDPWRDWDPEQLESLTATGWYTVRRLDPFTVGNLDGSATPDPDQEFETRVAPSWDRIRVSWQ